MTDRDYIAQLEHRLQSQDACITTLISTGKQYSFGNHIVEKEVVKQGKIFCVICSAEVDDAETDYSRHSPRP